MSGPGTLLVVDDERNIRRSLRMVLEGAGYDVLEAGSAEEALETLDGTAQVDLMILDLKLPGMDGAALLDRIRAREDTAALPVLVISGHASLGEAVSAVQRGATDFFEKPLDRDRVLVSVKNALRASLLERELARLRRDTEGRYQMLGESQAMRALYGQIEKVAPTTGRVLITGESGTGKELVARAIHRLSQRADRPFVKVNCAAIPSELIESELFGYERGAFTGAQGRRRGLFEQADGGTIFLDEVGDMSATAQAKVLRVLQSGEVHRLGSEQPIAVDVRVLAATNKDLDEEVAAGRFREDLFFRLNVVPLHTPPLRERREDVPRLARAFVEELCRRHDRRGKTLADDAIEALQRHDWPGNVRELQNVVERMVILGDDPLTSDDLPPEVVAPSGAAPAAHAHPSRSIDAVGIDALLADAAARELTLREVRDEAERRYVAHVLEAVDGNVSKAAARLGVERTNLHKKLKALGLR